MSVLEVKHKRKSAIITAMILILILFGIFNYGLQYLDPPAEYGLAINFGTFDDGAGEPVEEATKIRSPKLEKKSEIIEEEVVETSKETIEEELITDLTSKEVSIVEKTKEGKKEPLKEVVKNEPLKPKLSKETQDALNSLLRENSPNKKLNGEGDDKQLKVKGSEKGDVNESKYDGDSGIGADVNYNLAGRKALIIPKEQPDCQEEGVVVVRIQVDKSGNVIYALAGVKGTTNSAPCLLKPAKEAALRTKWNADSNAALKQVGTIIYKFSLTK